MQEGIHPNYKEIQVNCSCGHKFVMKSTYAKDELHLDVCSSCHPFYTGKQKNVDAGGRVEKFRKKYAAKKEKVNE